MATRKKPAKKTTKKATVKRSVAKKSSASSFWKIEFSINTIYWIAIGIAVISVAVLSYNTNQQVNDIYDQIDATRALED